MTKSHHALCPSAQTNNAIQWCCCISLETAEEDMLVKAREAVEGMLLVDPDPTWDTPVRACIDAIDLLREES